MATHNPIQWHSEKRMISELLQWHSEKRMISELQLAEYNPRQASEKDTRDLTTSLQKFSLAAPIVINKNNRVIGGHFRLNILKQKGVIEVDVRVPNRLLNEQEEKELNLRLNKNLGTWNFDLLANYDEVVLKDVGFDSEELDKIFDLDLSEPEQFNLQKELERLKIGQIRVQKGDIWELGHHRLMCGSSTNPADLCKLIGDQRMDFCFTDPPYILDYLHTKYKGKPNCKGFGYRANRRYLETDEDPTFEKLIPHIAKLLKENANIMIFENWKNVIPLWQEMEKHWKIRNLVIWHLSNRVQGFAAKYKFFNKYDIAMLGTQGETELNLESEEELLQNEFETALYATVGKPHWESYGKGKKYCPTDVTTFRASDTTHSGQGIIFGTKPIEVLIPYLKVLTKRGDNVIEPFGGSGSTLIACEKMKRKCFVMELVPTYCEVIMARWKKLTGQDAIKINE